MATVVANAQSEQNTSNMAFELRKVNSQAGLYFEEIGRMRLFHEDWKLITYLNLSVYQEEYEHLKSMVNKMSQACKDLDSEPIETFGIDVNCGPVFEQITAMVAGMDEYNARWFLKKGKNRRERGLLNIVGSVSKALFGTLDERDAQNYLDEFKRLSNENKLRDRINEEHTSLLQSLTNLMKESEEERMNQTKTLTKQITAITKLVEDLRKSYVYNWYIKLKTQILDMTSYVTLLILDYQNKQKSFLDAVTVGQKSPNSPSLIPPQMFLEELENIKKEVNARDLDFPLEPKTETLATFYLISTPEARIVQNQLIISFTLPLVTTIDYLLYKVTSLPYRIRGNLFGYVVPTHEFVALDAFKEKYVSIDADELDNCHHIGERKLACKQTTPIMTAHSTKNCEINMLRMSNSTEMCNERIANLTSELWIKLRQTNTYIYTFPERENVYIKCPKVLESRFLKDTGIIRMNPDCQIKTDNVIIRGFKTTETDRMREIVPAVRLKNEFNITLGRALELEDFRLESIVMPNIVNLGQKEKLKSISTGIDRVKLMENELRNQWTPSKMRNDIWKIATITLIVIIVVGIMILWFIVRRIGKFRKFMRNRAIVTVKRDNEELEGGGHKMEESLGEEIIENETVPKNTKPDVPNRKPLKTQAIVTWSERGN